MTSIRKLASLTILALVLSACSREPTPIEIPPGASSVEGFPLAVQGGAFQTQFTLHATYPATPALDFFRAHIGTPWVLCEWTGPEWSRFVDAQSEKHFTVFQRLYMWVNPEASRTLMLSMRYHAAENCGDAPDNDTQQILLVEHLATDVAGEIKQLQLRCPAASNVAR